MTRTDYGERPAAVRRLGLRRQRRSPSPVGDGSGSPASGLRRGYLPFVTPALVVLGLLTLVPTLATLALSLSDFDIRTFELSFTGLDNYTNLLTDARFLNSVKASIIFLTVPVILQMILGTVVALVLHEKLHATRWLRAAFMAPMLLPTIIMGLLWRTLFAPQLGGINYFLEVVGIPGPAWLTSEFWAFGAIIITAVWGWTPFVALMMLSGLQQIPTELQEAAVVDGASWTQWVRTMALPLLWPIARVVVIFRIMEALAIFPIIFIVTNGGPATATETMNFFAYLQGFEYFELSYAAAAVMVFLVVILLFSAPALTSIVRNRDT